ncbi:phenazine biosynthesis protein PhzF [Nocardioides sp. Soil797]|nr:phenazine biosynthesis protein PhzF [Nocardioides sp. Soil797]
MTTLDFSQVDVFAPAPLTGNPVAVVHDAVGLTDDQLAAFARWTNLSETTFLLPPTDPAADYRLRIFTPSGELPFAGHPTLGSARAWLDTGGVPADEVIVQECGIGLVDIRRTDDALAFRAPGFLRSGPVSDDDLARACAALGIAVDEVAHSSWIDNGPGWLGMVLASAERVLAIEPDLGALTGLHLGVIGPHGADGPADHEVRAFVPGAIGEDPVTGSLNAGFAVWLVGAALVPADYTVRQGTALQRAGDVRITTDAAGDQWVGGAARTLIRGTVEL